jgi:hypothetical protein
MMDGNAPQGGASGMDVARWSGTDRRIRASASTEELIDDLTGRRTRGDGQLC